MGYNMAARQSDDNLIRFNPVTNGWTILEVDNFPFISKDNSPYTTEPTSVYVNKLNRIYYFGGIVANRTSKEAEYRDDIWYIDLSPLNPTEPPRSTSPASPSFSCLNKPDG
jgi:hypothetical protein